MSNPDTGDEPMVTLDELIERTRAADKVFDDAARRTELQLELRGMLAAKRQELQERTGMTLDQVCAYVGIIPPDYLETAPNDFDEHYRHIQLAGARKKLEDFERGIWEPSLGFWLRYLQMVGGDPIALLIQMKQMVGQT